ncbi:unnamed protein product [Rotaria magnacalcarata]|uniref:Uncharacterized protein n=3 Tax=Rotaria magnacalcarata TaxID=392030 RepID=A0A820A120_9BILA|nr:unnamed protein product [Rotaria magnacalcarata]CAF2204533.1 unnamed protein product [Rotaria magnacalcarata]CAF3943113.1 unnamed protein product [Rotaria magnacalcarata]CAF4177879.1 unnamed protein product [Rotaria magnacalcarata]
MSSFICPLCQNGRVLVNFGKVFRRIPMFHQNEARLQMTCNLYSTCGVSYRTYSTFKSHIYPNRSHELHLKEENADTVKILAASNSDGMNSDANIGISLLNNDVENQLMEIDNDGFNLCNNASDLDLLQDVQEEINNNITDSFNSSAKWRVLTYRYC